MTIKIAMMSTKKIIQSLVCQLNIMRLHPTAVVEYQHQHLHEVRQYKQGVHILQLSNHQAQVGGFQVTGFHHRGV